MSFTSQIPLSWLPIDFTTEIMPARAYNSVKMSEYKDLNKFIERLKAQGYYIGRDYDSPMQATAASHLSFSKKELYASLECSFTAALRFGCLVRKHMAVINRGDTIDLFHNCLCFTSIPYGSSSVFGAWLDRQRPDFQRESWLSLGASGPKVPWESPIPLNYSSIQKGTFYLWRVCGPKTKMVDDSDMTDRRIELKL